MKVLQDCPDRLIVKYFQYVRKMFCDSQDNLLRRSGKYYATIRMMFCGAQENVLRLARECCKAYMILICT